ncbi:hypothetical protein MMC17_000240, partial [Xylographa soralifera]|nr:hypothetical protein [Xylographa soralifera]
MAASILDLHVTHPSLSLTSISSTPSRNPKPMANLASILELDSLSTTCVGWAKTQGRRCRNPIAYHNQVAARSALADGDQKLRAGRSVESVLHNVAPLLLCRRWHQNQTGEVATKWCKKVDSYQESRRTVSVESQIVSAETLRDMAVQLALLQREIRRQAAVVAHALAEREGGTSPIPQQGTRQLQIEAPEVHDRSESVEEAPRGGQEPGPQDRVESSTSEAPPESTSSSQETHHVPEPIFAETPSASEASPPASSNLSPIVEESTPTATRKPIGDNPCYICYEDLLDDGQDGDSSEEMAPHLLVW